MEPVDALLTHCTGTQQIKAGVKHLRGWVHIHSYLGRAGNGIMWLPGLLLTSLEGWLISCTQIMVASFAVAGWLKTALGHSC